MISVVPLQELQALARAVALDAAVSLHVGRPGCGWFVHAGLPMIEADPIDLRRGPADLVRGLVCHEAAHVAVTRYLRLVTREIRRSSSLIALFNALEDCRIETWLQRRFPGTAPWIRLYNARMFPVDAPALGRDAPADQFCFGVVHAWWHGGLPRNVAPAVGAALLHTHSARLAYVEAQPPCDARTAACGGERFEVAAERAAQAAADIARSEILPVYRGLLGDSA